MQTSNEKYPIKTAQLAKLWAVHSKSISNKFVFNHFIQFFGIDLNNISFRFICEVIKSVKSIRRCNFFQMCTDYRIFGHFQTNV